MTQQIDRLAEQIKGELLSAILESRIGAEYQSAESVFDKAVDQLAALAKQQASLWTQTVQWQVRSKSSNGGPWGAWQNCSAERAEVYQWQSELFTWHHDVRTLPAPESA